MEALKDAAIYGGALMALDQLNYITVDTYGYIRKIWDELFKDGGNSVFPAAINMALQAFILELVLVSSMPDVIPINGPTLGMFTGPLAVAFVSVFYDRFLYWRAPTFGSFAHSFFAGFGGYFLASLLSTF